jgi:hypothetical protein
MPDQCATNCAAVVRANAEVINIEAKLDDPSVDMVPPM